MRRRDGDQAHAKRIEFVIPMPAAASSSGGASASSDSTGAPAPEPLRFSMKAYALIRPAKLPSVKNLDGVLNT